MSNPYYNVVSYLVAGSTVKIAPHNSQWAAIQAGFAGVDSALKRAVKITGLASGGEVVANANTFLLLNGSGAPTSSATLTFSPNGGGYRYQNLGVATTTTDGAQWGQVIDLVNTTAFGAPTVVTLPVLAGNAGKQLHVNSGATATEWKNVIPVTAGTGESLSSVAGAPTWTRNGANLLAFSSMDWISDYSGIVAYPGWTVGANVVVGTDIANSSQLGVARNFGAIAGAQDLIKTAVAYSPTATVGATYTASVDFSCEAASANKILLFVRFFDVSNVLLGADTTLNISATTDNVMRRYSLQATAPASTSYAVIGIKCNAPIVTVPSFRARLFQFESGSTPSAWNDVKSARALATYMGTITHEEDFSKTTVGIGINGSEDAVVEWRSKASGTGYSVKARARAGGTVDGAGVLDVTAKRVIFSKTLGFASVYHNGSLGATPTFDWYNGQKQDGTLTTNTTATLTAPDADIVLDGLRLRLTFGGAGGWTVAFTSTATIRWTGNVAPTAANGMVTTAGQELECLFDWDGTRFVGRWTNL